MTFFLRNLARGESNFCGCVAKQIDPRTEDVVVRDRGLPSFSDDDLSTSVNCQLGVEEFSQKERKLREISPSPSSTTIASITAARCSVSSENVGVGREPVAVGFPKLELHPAEEPESPPSSTHPKRDFEQVALRRPSVGRLSSFRTMVRQRSNEIFRSRSKDAAAHHNCRSRSNESSSIGLGIHTRFVKESGLPWRSQPLDDPSSPLTRCDMGLWELPSIEPPDEYPNCEQHIPTATVRAVRDALLSDGEQAALTAYFSAAGCADVVVSPWMQGCRQIGTKIQRSRYKAPSPGDLPEFLCRAMGIPKWIQGETLSCVGPLQDIPEGGEKVVLGQHVWAEGICYSDLFRIQILHEFSTCRSGGITWKQWLSVHWMKPMPWSQIWLAKIIEKRAKYEGRFTAKSFVHVIATSSEYVITSNAKSRSESADSSMGTIVAL